MRRLAAAVAVAAFPAAGVAAEPRVDVFAFGGASLLDVSHVARGPCFTRECTDTFVVESRLERTLAGGAAVGYRLATNTWAEAALTVAPSHHSDVSTESSFFHVPIEVRREVVAYQGTLMLRHELGRGRTRPFVSAGFGHTRYETDEILPLRRGEWGMAVGGGLARPIGGRLRGRVELIDQLFPNHFVGDKLVHDLRLRVGLSARF